MMKKKRYPIFITLLIAVVITLALGISARSDGALSEAALPDGTEYNGIKLPDVWPPSTVDPKNDDELTPPYLISSADGGYKPEIINIDTGRQLFVDSFLIGSTDLKTVYHKAVKYENNPVLKPETKTELTSTQPSAAPISGGIWYDEVAKQYKMWYEAGWNNRLAYATSADGINWERPAINGDGTNTLVRTEQIDSTSVWMDYSASPAERYKLLIRDPGGELKGAKLYISTNGINWKKVATTGLIGDRSTFFYNPFRKVFVYSIRNNESIKWRGNSLTQRARFYHESPDFATMGDYQWSDSDVVFWQKTDKYDMIDLKVSGEIPQLYNFDSIAYESVMVGFFQIWYGPHNNVVNEEKRPKITELQASYSRDGFYYSRPLREALINAERAEGTWDRGYVQSITGSLIVYDDELRIYYTGFSGSYNDGTKTVTGMHVGGSVGYATLRRDGFASLDGSGSVTTTDLTVTKDVKYLFVNANVTGGSLKAEILDSNGNVLPGYSTADCEAMTAADDCSYKLTWKGADDLSFLRGKRFRLRFSLENGEFYSFWLSNEENGASGGMTGAGYAGTELIVKESETTASTQDTTALPTQATTAVSEIGGTTAPSATESGCSCSDGKTAALIFVMTTLCAALITVFTKKRPI